MPKRPSASPKASLLSNKDKEKDITSNPRKCERIRAALACDFCIRRKIRCSSELTCSQCAQRGQECIYSRKPKRRGPPKGSSKTSMREMKERLEKLESMLKEQNETTTCSIGGNEKNSGSNFTNPIVAINKEFPHHGFGEWDSGYYFPKTEPSDDILEYTAGLSNLEFVCSDQFAEFHTPSLVPYSWLNAPFPFSSFSTTTTTYAATPLLLADPLMTPKVTRRFVDFDGLPPSPLSDADICFQFPHARQPIDPRLVKLTY